MRLPRSVDPREFTSSLAGQGDQEANGAECSRTTKRPHGRVRPLLRTTFLVVVGENARGFVSPDNRASAYTTCDAGRQDSCRSRNNNMPWSEVVLSSTIHQEDEGGLQRQQRRDIGLQCFS